jgi:hypothetical protein
LSKHDALKTKPALCRIHFVAYTKNDIKKGGELKTIRSIAIYIARASAWHDREDQECQRRHSQASKVPGIIAGCFLSRNMRVMGFIGC